MRTVPKAKQPETEIPFQPAVYTVHDRKFIVDSVYKDEPAETLDEILLRLIKKDIEKG